VGQGHVGQAQLGVFVGFQLGLAVVHAELETNKNTKLRLADMPLPNGILRVDQYAGPEAVAARLGHYALPNLTGTIRRSTRKIEGHEVQLIDNGTYQLALVNLSGWDQLETLDTNGLNPVKPGSTLLNASAQMAPGPKLYATLMLWKKSGTKWTKAELLPVRQLTPTATGAAAVLADGTRKAITFE